MVAFLTSEDGRIWAAVEVRPTPSGGSHTRCQSHNGLSRTTNSCRLEGSGRGPKRSKADGRVRQRGAGRKLLTHHAPDIVQALDALVEPSSRGAPESLLRWTCKSTRRLAQELQRQGYNIGDRKVADLLRQLNYSLQANAKTLEGRQHPDRNAQFEYINTLSKRFYRRWPTGDIGGHQEKRVGGRLQKCGARMAAAGATGRDAGA